MWPSRRVELASSPLPTVRELDTQAQNYFSRSEPNFFDLLHSSWAQKHCSTYKLVYKPMYSDQKICIISDNIIINALHCYIVEFEAEQQNSIVKQRNAFNNGPTSYYTYFAV